MPLKKQQDLISSIQDAAEQALDQTVLLGLITVLSLLKANPNISQKRLSAAISVSPPNLATLLDRLEERHLLLRQRNPLDKRSQTLVLTPDGQRLCTKAEKAVVELEAAAAMGLNPEEHALLISLLQKIA